MSPEPNSWRPHKEVDEPSGEPLLLVVLGDVGGPDQCQPVRPLSSHRDKQPHSLNGGQHCTQQQQQQQEEVEGPGGQAQVSEVHVALVEPSYAVGLVVDVVCHVFQVLQEKAKAKQSTISCSHPVVSTLLPLTSFRCLSGLQILECRSLSASFSPPSLQSLLREGGGRGGEKERGWRWLTLTDHHDVELKAGLHGLASHLVQDCLDAHVAKQITSLSLNSKGSVGFNSEQPEQKRPKSPPPPPLPPYPHSDRQSGPVLSALIVSPGD
ncbi:hypothetical protein INR49_028199 [Caranx melampygus]|nr:hypothetical protein INR49_028199 [Caranx melampygus]